MPNYKLGTFKRGKLLKEIDDFSYKSLAHVDELTRQFEDEYELKKYLICKGYITSEDLDKDIYVKYNYNKEVKKIPVMYSDIDKYFDLHYLRNKLFSYADDNDFLYKLAKYFQSNKFLSINSSQIFYYLNSVKFNGGRHFYSDALREALNGIFETTSLEVYPYNGKENTLYRYKAKRDFIMFMYKYENKDNIKDKKESTNVNAKKVKVKEIEYRQMTLFEGPNSIL